jgi:hypothetical protein
LSLTSILLHLLTSNLPPPFVPFLLPFSTLPFLLVKVEKHLKVELLGEDGKLNDDVGFKEEIDGGPDCKMKVV